MKNFPNRIVVNRKSPKNEQDYINAYKQMNPDARKSDKMDICAVRTPSGENGHALMNQSINRGRDRNRHIGKDFISDKDLRDEMK